LVSPRPVRKFQNVSQKFPSPLSIPKIFGGRPTMIVGIRPTNEAL
jgi:hypothetical protein